MEGEFKAVSYRGVVKPRSKDVDMLKNESLDQAIKISVGCTIIILICCVVSVGIAAIKIITLS